MPYSSRRVTGSGEALTYFSCESSHFNLIVAVDLAIEYEEDYARLAGDQVRLSRK